MTFSFFAELLAIILMIKTGDPNEKICIHYSMFFIERLSCTNYFTTRLFVAYYHSINLWLLTTRLFRRRSSILEQDVRLY